MKKDYYLRAAGIIGIGLGIFNFILVWIALAEMFERMFAGVPGHLPGWVFNILYIIGNGAIIGLATRLSAAALND